MRTPGYWTFTLLFWLAAGVLLFLSGLWSDHWNRVVMRFLYFPVLGVALTAVMTLVFQSERFASIPHRAVWTVGLSLLAALLTAMILNPITYLILGIDLRDDHLRKMTTGFLGFAVSYLFWCVLFFELDGRPLLGNRQVAAAGYLSRLDVDDRGDTRSVDVADIEFIAASGDYVEVQLPEGRFLRKATITSLLSALDPDRFRRVHRSTIVNVDRVVEVRPRSGSGFEIELAGGHTVTSSRSYRATVDSIVQRLSTSA